MAGRRLQIDCQDCGLCRLCLARELDAADREQLASRVLVHTSLTCGECLFSAGEAFRSIYALRSGAFKTHFAAADGHSQISGFHLPGELLGLEAISGGAYHCTAEALERSAVCEIPYEAFGRLAHHSQRLHSRLHEIMSRELGYARSLMMLSHKKSARTQLALFLLNLSSRLQARGFSGQICHLSMSRKDLANHLGISVETLCRLLASLQRDRILRIQRRSVQLVDLHALRDIAGLPATALPSA